MDPVDDAHRSTPRPTRQHTTRPDNANLGTPTSPTVDPKYTLDGPTINLAAQDLDMQVASTPNKINTSQDATTPVHESKRQHHSSGQSDEYIDVYNKLEAMERQLRRASIEIKVNKSALNDAHGKCIELENRVMSLGQRVSELEHMNNKLQFQVDSTENYSRAKNIKIDGIAEKPNEDLTQLICDLAKEEGKIISPNDIEAAFRIGRINQQANRPRQVMIKFKDQTTRNAILFSKGNLKGKEAFRRVWINDDVAEGTQKLREEARAINLLCKEKGILNTKIHGDGIVIDGRKYKLNELTTLPEHLSLDKAKTIVRDNRIYFQSQCSKLSNFYRCDIRLPDGHFTSSEQAYQWRKAIHAKEFQIANLIKCESNSLTQKRLGDRIGNTKEWNDVKMENMLEIVTAKFGDSPALKTALLETDGCTLHEATKDTYWGIGATLYSDEAKRHTWHGKDQLGNLLVKLRDTLSQTTV